MEPSEKQADLEVVKENKGPRFLGPPIRKPDEENNAKQENGKLAAGDAMQNGTPNNDNPESLATSVQNGEPQEKVRDATKEPTHLENTEVTKNNVEKTAENSQKMTIAETAVENSLAKVTENSLVTQNTGENSLIKNNVENTRENSLTNDEKTMEDSLAKEENSLTPADKTAAPAEKVDNNAEEKSDEKVADSSLKTADITAEKPAAEVLPKLPSTPPPQIRGEQLDLIPDTIEEEPELRVKAAPTSPGNEEPELRVKAPQTVPRRPASLQPTRPGAISRLATAPSSAERSPISVAAPRRAHSFVLGLEAAPGSSSLVNSVASSVHAHRQQFLQRRSMFEAPASSQPRRNSRQFEIELRALKLGNKTLDGDERPRNYGGLMARQHSFSGGRPSRASDSKQPTS